MEFQNHVTADTIKLHEARQKNVRNGYAPMYTQKQVQRAIDTHYSLIYGIETDDLEIYNQYHQIKDLLFMQRRAIQHNNLNCAVWTRQALKDRRKILAYLLEHKRKLEYALAKLHK